MFQVFLNIFSLIPFFLPYLAVMDARTFQPKNQIPLSLHMNALIGIFHNLGAVISYDPAQKWYYYSRQSTTEVLVFHQYSKVSFRNTAA